MSAILCSRSTSPEPLFLVEKYIDSDCNPICQRSSTAQAKREAIRVLIDRILPGLDDRHRRPIQNVFTQLVAFHRHNRFSARRAATSVSILIEVLLILSRRQLPQPEFVFAHYKAMLMRHSIKRTPFSIAVFSLVEVKLLTRFFLDCVLRYCHLYQYILGKARYLQLHFDHTIAPIPPTVPPLSQGKIVEPEPVLPLQSDNKSSVSDALTPDQIQLILSDPVAKARFEALVQPKLAELQSHLDSELEKLDRLYAEKQANRK